jgi:hypothetical protein
MLPLDQVTDVIGFRREVNGWQSFGRTIDAISGQTDMRYSAPVWIPDNNQVLVITATSIELHGAGGNVTDVAPPSWQDSTYWYHTQLGKWIVITNSLDPVFWLDTQTIGGGGKFEELPGWPATDRCEIIENYKNHLLAARITRSGIYKPNLLKWSHPVALDDTATVWDPTLPEYTAGEVAIETPGRDIQALGVLGDMGVVAFDQSMWVLDYTGSIRPPFNLRKTPTADGATGPFSMTNVGGALLVYGLRDIYLFNGHGKERSLTDNRLTEWLRDAVSLDFRPVCAFYPATNEAHILIRQAASGCGDIILIYNTALDIWYPVSAIQGGQGGVLNRCFLGPRLDGEATTWADMQATGKTWADIQGEGARWSDLTTISGESVFYYEDCTNGRVIALDQPGDAWFGARQSITHGRCMFDDAYDVKTISRLYPLIRGTGTVRFRFGSAYDMQSSVQFEPWIEYEIGTDIAVDKIISGRYFAWEMSPVLDARVDEFTGFDVEVDVTGRN